MSDDSSKTWLDTLEAAVHQAAETIERLRTERDELATRVEELEGRIEGLAGGEAPSGGAAAAAWQAERQEIRRRVQKLADRLEGLLEDDE